MSILYSLLWYLFLPFIILVTFIKGLKQKEFRLHERLSLFLNLKQQRFIWLHTVSVGELRAVYPIVEYLQNQYANIPILITTTTWTASQQVKKKYHDKVYHVYFPFDLPDVINRFLSTIKPCLAIILETEIWPNLYKACAKRKIPLLLLNARLSERSYKKYKKIKKLIQETLACTSHIAAQTVEDAQRFIALGVNNVSISGNLKFELNPPVDIAVKAQEIINDWGNRKIWIAASTHAGEDEILLQAHQLILKIYPNALCLIAPRHPERFLQVENLIKQQGFSYIKRSESIVVKPEQQVLLLDCIGELLLWYKTAHVALVAGSLVKGLGGHNPLEPASLEIPVISGRYIVNFQQIYKEFEKEQAVIFVNNAEEIAEKVLYLFDNIDYAKTQAHYASALIQRHRGALEYDIALIERYLCNH